MSPTADVVQAGTSDLMLVEKSEAAPARKFSGNSLRAKRTHLLYHGTLLYDFDLALIETCLRDAAAATRISSARHHNEFVTNLPLTRER